MPGITALQKRTAADRPSSNRYFDGRLSTYNLRPSHLRRTRAALARARGGTGLASIAFVGDSTTAGTGATTGSTDWPSALSSQIVTSGIPSTGTGFVAGYRSSTVDARWVFPAGWAALSGSSSLMTNSTTTNAAVFTSTTTGSIVRVYYANTGGAFTVSIDGATAVTVTPTGAQSMAVYAVTGLSSTTHSISIARTAGNAQIFGAEVATSTTTGLRTYNGGIGGSTVPSASAWYQVTEIATAAAAFNADLAFLLYETNDTGVTAVGTYQTRFQAMAQTAKSNGSDVVLVTAVPSSGKTFDTYTAAIYATADLLDLPVIDLQDRWGTYTLMNGFGLMSDGLHPNAAGYAEVARAVNTALGL